MSTFRIISFDGGGVRGALSARLFKRLTDRYPELIARTHMFSGTSTGSLLAISLAYGKPSDYVDNMFNYKDMKYIFTPMHKGPFRPAYDSGRLRQILENIVPTDLKISDLGKYVFIPAFHIRGYGEDTRQVIFFNNLLKNPYINETAINVALYSSAAPVYFSSLNDFIDGGLITNSPLVASVIYTQSALPNRYNINDFRLLSISTGAYHTIIDKDTSKWGLVQWLYNPSCQVKFPLYSCFSEYTTRLESAYCKELLGDNFHRIEPLISKYIKISDYKKLDELRSIADNLDLTDTYRFIEDYFLR